jgi:Four helix bundle sensory module for signal transduction
MFAHYSIRAKLYGGFIALLAMSGVAGLYALYNVVTTGQIAVVMYDKVLQSTDAARSAQSDFSEMRRLTALMLTAGDNAPDGLRQSYGDSRSTLADDLEIAASRAPNGEIRASVEAVGVACGTGTLTSKRCSTVSGARTWPRSKRWRTASTRRSTSRSRG